MSIKLDFQEAKKARLALILMGLLLSCSCGKPGEPSGSSTTTRGNPSEPSGSSTTTRGIPSEPPGSSTTLCQPEFVVRSTEHQKIENIDLSKLSDAEARSAGQTIFEALKKYL